MIFIRQQDSMQCGIACLAMVCECYGKRYSIDTLSHMCFATTEGVSFWSISQIAEILGLDTISGRVSTKQLLNASFPCILHWNQNHFVVFYKVSRNGKKFHVADPGKGMIKYNRAEFEQHWISTQSGGEGKGITMFLEQPLFFLLFGHHATVVDNYLHIVVRRAT